MDTETEDSYSASETDDSSTRTDAGTEQDPATTQVQNPSELPVQTGEVREVEVETIGDQGDGIARVERGYMIIVPETGTGDQVTIEITALRENVAFGDVVERRIFRMKCICSCD